jgi:competence protein ComEA
MASSKPGASLRGYLALSLVWLIVLVVTLLFMRRPATQPIEILPPPTALPSASAKPLPPATPSATPTLLRVDVAGAVQSPAVYRLSPGSIVADAIAAAGGPAPDAQLDRINKALPLIDGMQIYVPRLGEDGPPAVQRPAVIVGTGAVSAETPPALVNVNVNTATSQELDTLPGIGPALAQRIIAGRPYSAIEDLLRVAGIGQTVFDKLKSHITVQ